MAGLADILGKAVVPKGAPPSRDSESGMPAAEEAEGDSAKQYARIAAEAIGDKDYDAAADALVSMAKACNSK